MSGSEIQEEIVGKVQGGSGADPKDQLAPSDPKHDSEGSSRQNVSTEPRKIGILGYQVGDWGAALALVLSIGTLSWNIIDKYLVSPDPQLVPPNTINFFCPNSFVDGDTDRCPTDDFLVVRVNPLTFLNRATDPHAYVVRSVRVNVVMLDSGGKVVKSLWEDWEYFSEIAVRSDERRTPIAPLTVEGQSSESREVEFYPRRSVKEDGSVSFENKLPFEDFLELIGTSAIANLQLTFVAKTIYPELEFDATCTVPVDHDFIANAASRNFVLFSRECK